MSKATAKTVASVDRIEFMEVAEILMGRLDRLTGAGFWEVRMALGLSEHELAVELATTERSILEAEADHLSVIPEQLDHRIRKLYFAEWN